MKARRRGVRWIVLALLWASLSSCSRGRLTDATRALRRVRTAPDLVDDLPLRPLLDAVRREIAWIGGEPGARVFRFGAKVYTRDEYLAGLRRFVELGEAEESSHDAGAFFEAVRREFDFYEVYGQRGWGDVFMTSYYEPVIPGFRRPRGRFTRPLYGVPRDLVSINLAAFDPRFAGERELRGRVRGRALVPYFTREEIDSRGALGGRGLELCWVDPVDAFVAQIQGSATVRLDDGRELRLNYGEKNGRKYQSIGNFLRGVLSPDRLTMPSIERYLRTLGPGPLQALLNRNPSYVFFQLLPQDAVTYLGVPATPGRTIATDPRYFPKGALGFLVSHAPKDGGQGEEISRFVLDQDTGGAIRGGGRVDLFWGRGPEAAAHAGIVQQRGTLYYLAPRSGS